jgi:hypothetical protein
MSEGNETDPMSAMETDDELKRVARTTSILIIVSAISFSALRIHRAIAWAESSWALCSSSVQSCCWHSQAQRY